MSDKLNVEADPLLDSRRQGVDVSTTKDSGIVEISSADPDVSEKLLSHPDFVATKMLCYEMGEMARHTHYAQSVEEARKYEGIYRVEGELLLGDSLIDAILNEAAANNPSTHKVSLHE